MRRAIAEMVDKGMLVRKRGVGTQVVQGLVTRPVAHAVRLVRGNLGTNTQLAIDGSGSHPGATDLRAS